MLFGIVVFKRIDGLSWLGWPGDYQKANDLPETSVKDVAGFPHWCPANASVPL